MNTCPRGGGHGVDVNMSWGGGGEVDMNMFWVGLM